jgi:hypothetical protein
MSHIRVLICRVDEQNDDAMTELACFDLAEVDVAGLEPETALDDLEASTQEVGYAILRRLLQAQWEAIDENLAEEYRQRFSP